MNKQKLAPELDLYLQAAVGKKAENLIALDVRGLTSIADYFIVCSGRSNRQVSAIAEHIERFLRKEKIHPLSVEGRTEGHWVLMDYGHVIIHVFYQETRRFYDLEGLWVDAKRVATALLDIQTDTVRKDFNGQEIFVE